MGGRVLEHEGKTILNRGIAIGEAQGEARGRREANFEFARRLHDGGMSDDEIHRFTDLSIDEIKLLYKN